MSDATFRVEGGTVTAAAPLVEVLDMMAATSGVARLRAWSREALGPRPGDRAVDVGSGTGDELQVLAALVGPSGEAVGIEPNAGLRAEAASRRDSAGSSAVFLDGDAYALPFADASLDVVRCERVLQHLDSPSRAVAELARVARPGGRVVVIDTDWATAILHPGDPAVVETMQRIWLRRYPTRSPAGGWPVSSRPRASWWTTALPRP